MNDFDPGPGWREATEREWLSTPIDADHLELASHGTIRHWVREVSVPALPTAPYTVIRITWRADDITHDGWPKVLIRDGGGWEGVDIAHTFDSAFVHARITGFEVLSEPRAVTAKVVLKAVQDAAGAQMEHVPENILSSVAREFGVES